MNQGREKCLEGLRPHRHLYRISSNFAEEHRVDASLWEPEFCGERNFARPNVWLYPPVLVLVVVVLVGIVKIVRHYILRFCDNKRYERVTARTREVHYEKRDRAIHKSKTDAQRRVLRSFAMACIHMPSNLKI